MFKYVNFVTLHMSVDTTIISTIVDEDVIYFIDNVYWILSPDLKFCLS